MLSSQEQTIKDIYIVERNIEAAIKNERKNSILNKYVTFLLEEKNAEKANETNIRCNYSKVEKLQNYSLVNKYLALQVAVQSYNKRLEELKEEVDNLTIQSLADKGSFKIREDEEEKERKSAYITEENTIKQELEDVIKESTTTEEDFKAQIALELATQNNRLREIKGNLQRKVIERNGEFVKAQLENNEIRKKLDALKAEVGRSEKELNHKPNVIYFDNGSLPQEKQSNFPKKSFYTNPSEPTISHYKRTEPTNDLQEIMNTKRSEFNTTYNQFERNFAQPVTNEIPTQRCSYMKPNSYCLEAKPEKVFQYQYMNNQKSSATEAKYNSTEIEDFEPDFPKWPDFKRTNDPFGGKSNVARKLPTVYTGTIKNGRFQNKN